ncbi:hypothetical protein CHS0354_003063 [Potamilus streckersoni]|uniref:Uncharacterized protein n=1 Tax=Potamilus streckersoni TaxID=2493646 RepID=A0AAE0SEX8_9BIVA|nr:hypothetical protein CHS0354_003063 [Potamilus streckersoni]
MHNMSVMHIHTPVWLLFLVHSMCVSCIECGQKEELMDTELQHIKEETVCNITISHKSASYLTIKFNKIDPDVAHFNLKFPEGSVVNYKEDAIQPFRWIWTFQSDDRNVPFLEWGIHYEVLSLGLLNAKSLPESLVEFDVQPPNCSITIGNRKSNLEIAYAFSNMTNKYLHSVDIKYNNDYADNRNHSWCYVAESPLLKGSYQYNCCYSYYDFVNEQINVNCSDEYTRSYESHATVLQILGCIVLLYFPIPLLAVVSSMSGKKHRSDYIPLNEDIVYLDKCSPITISSIIYESFCKKYPRYASKILGILFICLFPVMIYIELILYYCIMKDTVVQLIKHGTNMGFLTMLGFSETGGEIPVSVMVVHCILIVVFCVLGIIIVVIPHENIGIVLEDFLINRLLVSKCYFFLTYDKVQLYSHMQIEDECVYGRLKSLMIARFFCIMNPTFWCHVWGESIDTGKECLTDIKTGLPKPIYYILALIIYLIRLLRFVIEIFLCLILHGLPGLFLFVLVLPGFIWYLMKWFFNGYNDGVFFKRIALYCVLGLVYGVYICFSYSLLMIFFASVQFILRVCFYLFVAVLIYPSMTIVSYQTFGIVLFYYLFKQLRGIGDTYFDLLSDTVTSLHILEAESNELIVVTSYKDRVPGIPRKLFLYVVQKHRPIFISVCKAILPIGLVIILMIGTIQITSFVSNISSTVTEVMKVILVVLIGTLPRALEIAFSNSNKSVLKEIFRKRLEATILEYNKGLVERQSSEDSRLDIVMPV